MSIETTASQCANCGTELLGPHCYSCGQPVKNAMRHFFSVLGDLFDTLLALDSRIARTLGPLMLRPGFLSREYFAGRRVRYVAPLRLFIFLCLTAFFAIRLSTDWSVADKWRDLNENIGRQGELSLVGGSIPTTLFLLLPLFALSLRILYLFSGRLYMEHLIVALHSHAFLSLALLLMAVIFALQRWLGAKYALAASLFQWTLIALLVWIPVYLLLMQKRVYGQGWVLTVLKFGVIGICYFALMVFGAVLTVMGSLVWL